MNKAINKDAENAIEKVKKLKMSDTNKSKVIDMIEGLVEKINPSCQTDNTSSIYKYGNAVFTQVSANFPEASKYLKEQSRREKHPLYLEYQEIEAKAIKEKDKNKKEQLEKEAEEVNDRFKEVFPNDDYKWELVKASFVGSKLNSGSVVIDGEKIPNEDITIEDISGFPPMAKTELFYNAFSLLTASGIELKN